MARMRRPLPIAAWLTGLVVIALLLRATGHGALAGPEVGAPGTWARWASARSAPEVAIALVRLALLAWTAYLLVVTLLVVAGCGLRPGRLAIAAGRLAPSFVRAIVGTGVGVGMLGATVVATTGAAGAQARRADVVVAADAPSPASTDTGADVAPVMQHVDGPSADVGGEAQSAAAVPAGAATWTVSPGDHLWSIAERVLTAAWGHAPEEGELVPFWQRLVAGNRTRLADPGNADLIYPGQVLLLPDPPRPR